MDAKAKIALAIGGLVLAGMVAWVLMPSSKTSTSDIGMIPTPTPAPATVPATAPVTDPFATPFSSTTMPAANTPPASRPTTPADAWNVLDNGPNGTAARNPAPTPTNIQRAPAPEVAASAARTYKVQHGDSLYTIAEKVLGSPKYVDQIIKANPGINPKTLKPGQEINLPQLPSSTAPRTDVSVGASTPTPAPTATAKTYTIAAGDTLAKISKKTYGREDQWKKIYDANKAAIGSDPSKLKVGTTLQIPE